MARRTRLTLLPLLAALAWAPAARAEVATYRDEQQFVRATGAGGPHRPPGSALADSVTVAGGLFVARPGRGANKVAVGNVIGQRAQLSVGNDDSPSNVDFQFAGPATVFGFVVANFTAEGFAGESEFRVTLLRGRRVVGSVSFVSPAEGEIFFGLRSTDPFDRVELREERGGPQNATPTGGAADREWFGEFYTDARERFASGQPDAAPGAGAAPAGADGAGPSWFALTLAGGAGLLLLVGVGIAVAVAVSFGGKGRRDEGRPPSRRRREGTPDDEGRPRRVRGDQIRGVRPVPGVRRRAEDGG